VRKTGRRSDVRKRERREKGKKKEPERNSKEGIEKNPHGTNMQAIQLGAVI